MTALFLSCIALAASFAALTIAFGAAARTSAPPTPEQIASRRRVAAAVHDFERRQARKQPRGPGGKFAVLAEGEELSHDKDSAA